MDQAQGQELYRMIMARHYLKSAVKLGSYVLSHERELAKGIKKKLERTVILYYSIPFRHTCSWGR
ncbi:hypothetical protein [Piscirickettsia litoralis]|uniref:Uncharacterized protein n=1 Tax=Piscirickettsia litoralis TaxID=1891921 RepID=A0ABX3A3E7_9GAMM|nr:hypothetical protein [Piscirickettsia litoralis]ODN43164.1 hypothetical protein BGC07_09860 [Piscirickettsia litoralis]